MDNLTGYLILIALLIFIIAEIKLIRKVFFLRKEKKALQDMLISLLGRYSNRDNILAHYTYDTKLGVYRHKGSGLYYCHKCFIEQTRESPLEAKDNGFFCAVCDSFYKAPPEIYPA